MMTRWLMLLMFSLVGTIAVCQNSVRARDLGIPFPGTPGKYNSITDVQNVAVGYRTLIEGDGPLVVGKGPVRTGVTVILPHGGKREFTPAGMCSFNGDGEFTGSHYINEYGSLPGSAIGITNTNSVGIVRDALGEWQFNQFSRGGMEDFSFGLPVVGETWDGDFNDINGYHVTKEHVFEAISSATGEQIKEGNVGGGTGMWLYGFKGGTGTSSRKVLVDSTEYKVGVLVQANFGRRGDLMVAGVPVGQEINDYQPEFHHPRSDGSIIVVIATDAPLRPQHLQLVARRASLGMARTGTIGGNGSGDIFLAFSTTAPSFSENYTYENWCVISKWMLDPIYRGTVEATEEAIINALVAAETMVGANGNKMYACPHDRLFEIMKKYNRYSEDAVDK